MSANPKSVSLQQRSDAKIDHLNQDCLARLYPGNRQDPYRRHSLLFSLRNFNLHMDQMEDLQLKINGFAMAMADALAIMHLTAMIDADDGGFMQGSSPTWKARDLMTMRPGTTKLQLGTEVNLKQFLNKCIISHTHCFSANFTFFD